MSEEIVLKANMRSELGRKVRALRREGRTPAVIHDHGKDSIHVSVTELELKQAYKSAGKHAPVKLDVDGKKFTTLIKEVTNKPGTSKTLHTVFQAVSADEKVSAEVPVKITGDIPAEKASLLVLTNVGHVEVEAKPADLVDVIEISGEKLAEVGDKLNVSDLLAPANVIIKTDPTLTIATVEMPKDQIAEADAALEEQKAAEGIIEEETAEEGAEGEEGAEEGEATESAGQRIDEKSVDAKDTKDAKSEEQ